MKLYHGTSLDRLEAILKDGIVPRAKRNDPGHWEKFPSNPDTVYLSSVYPLHFAQTAWCAQMEAGIDSSWPVLIEIDTEWLDTHRLIADEDALAQSLVATDKTKKLTNKLQIEMQRRAKLFVGTDLWEESLQALGTCGHWGTIHVPEQARIAILDPSEQGARQAIYDQDAVLSLVAFQIMKKKYANLIAWIFGDEEYKHLIDIMGGLKGDEEMPDWIVQVRNRIPDRSGITITTAGHLSSHGGDEFTRYKETFPARTWETR